MTPFNTHDRRFMALLFALHLPVFACVFVIGMTYQPQADDEFTPGLLGLNAGFGGGQILMLCAWTAFGTGSYRRRMLVSMLLVAIAFHAAWDRRINNCPVCRDSSRRSVMATMGIRQ